MACATEEVMTRFTQNLVVQFSVTSFIIMLILAVVISMVLTAKLNRSVEHLEAHRVAMDTMKTHNFSV